MFPSAPQETARRLPAFCKKFVWKSPPFFVLCISLNEISFRSFFFPPPYPKDVNTTASLTHGCTTDPTTPTATSTATALPSLQPVPTSPSSAAAAAAATAEFVTVRVDDRVTANNPASAHVLHKWQAHTAPLLTKQHCGWCWLHHHHHHQQQ